MSVSHRRPHDRNRRPQKSQSSRANSPALPPILFQLPNLKASTSSSTEDAAAEQSGSSVVDSAPTDGEVVFHPAHELVSSETEPVPESLESEAATHEASSPSRLEKFSSRAMTFGLIALAVAWVVVVARNVNFQPNQVVQSDNVEVETLDGFDHGQLERQMALDINDIDSGQLMTGSPVPELNADAVLGAPEPTVSSQIAPTAPALTASAPSVPAQTVSAPIAHAPITNVSTTPMLEPTATSVDSVFPNINLEAPLPTEATAQDLNSGLPSDAELKAELEAAMASLQTPAQSASASIPSAPTTSAMTEESLESLAELTPSLESAPRNPVQSSTPNQFDASKYAREVVHTPAKPTPTYSTTPLGVNDWTRYLPSMNPK